jgi:hypothetical protein
MNQIYHPGLMPTLRTPGKGVFQDNAYAYFQDFAVGGATAIKSTDSSAWGIFADTADMGEWLVSAVSPGLRPAIQDDQASGVVKMTTGSTNGQEICCQMNGETLYLAAGKRTVIEYRVQFDLLTVKALIGVSINATDPTGTTPSDIVAIAFSGDQDIETLVRTGSTGAVADSGTDAVINTWTVLTIEYTGENRVNFYKDGVRIASITSNVPNGVYMAPVFAIEPTNSAAISALWDYVGFVSDR